MIFTNLKNGKEISVSFDTILSMKEFPIVIDNSNSRIDISEYRFDRCEDPDETMKILELFSTLDWSKVIYWKPKNLICGYGETCEEFKTIFSDTFYIEMGLRAVFKDLIISYMEDNQVIVGVAEKCKIEFSNIWGPSGKMGDRVFDVNGSPCFNEFFKCCDRLDDALI